MFLSLSYAATPKNFVRDKVNLLILFCRDGINLKHVFSDHVNSDMDYKRFNKLCSQCWKGKHSFINIDKKKDSNNGRYREGFNCFATNITGNE